MLYHLPPPLQPVRFYCDDFPSVKKSATSKEDRNKFKALNTALNSAKCQYTAKNKCRKLEANIPRKGISGPQSQFPHSCVCEWIIYSHDGASVSAGGNMWTDPRNIYIAHRRMNVETGAEAAQFPEKEYIKGIAFAVYCTITRKEYFCFHA